MFNDPDRLISSTKRIGKNVEMRARENGKESSESVINVVPKKVYEAKPGAPVIDLGRGHVLVKVDEFVSRENLVGLDLDISNASGMPDMHITIKESYIVDMASLIRPAYLGEHFYAVMDSALWDMDSTIDISADLEIAIPEPGLYVDQSVILSQPEKADIKEGYEKFFLPIVTKADNEKHLVVKDGIWTPTKEEEETGPKFSVQGYTYNQLYYMFLANIPHPETAEESSEIINNVFKYMPIPLMTQIEANHKKVGRIIFDLVDCQIPSLGVGDGQDHIEIQLTFLMRDAIIGVPFYNAENYAKQWSTSTVKVYLEQFLNDFNDIYSFAMGYNSTILTHYCPPGNGSQVYPPRSASGGYNKHLGFFVPSVSELLGVDNGVSSIGYDLEGQQFIGLKKIGVHQKSEILTGDAHNYLFKPDRFINDEGEVVEHQGPVCLMTRTWDKTDTEGKHILACSGVYNSNYIVDVTSLGVGDTSVTIDNDVVDVCIRPAFKVCIKNYVPVS